MNFVRVSAFFVSMAAVYIARTSSPSNPPEAPAPAAAVTSTEDHPAAHAACLEHETLRHRVACVVRDVEADISVAPTTGSCREEGGSAIVTCSVVVGDCKVKTGAPDASRLASCKLRDDAGVFQAGCGTRAVTLPTPFETRREFRLVHGPDGSATLRPRAERAEQIDDTRAVTSCDLVRDNVAAYCTHARAEMRDAMNQGCRDNVLRSDAHPTSAYATDDPAFELACCGSDR